MKFFCFWSQIPEAWKWVLQFFFLSFHHQIERGVLSSLLAPPLPPTKSPRLSFAHKEPAKEECFSIGVCSTI